MRRNQTPKNGHLLRSTSLPANRAATAAILNARIRIDLLI